MNARHNVRSPEPIGLRASFGFGDRLGLATPGHILAARTGRFVPVFAQQSARELKRTGRTPAEILSTARQALAAASWDGAWGADADHLKTVDDVVRFAEAGFTLYTLDPSDRVREDADALTGDALTRAVDRVLSAGAVESVTELESLYLGTNYDVGEGVRLSFVDRLPLYRAVAKYGLALPWIRGMADCLGRTLSSSPYEIEVSVDETSAPTSPLEHLFIALELRRRGAPVVSLAPRFRGVFEKAVDYRDDLAEFERELRLHVAIATAVGPHKISVHSGSDKFRVYPVLGEVCGELLHVKTAGTSYLAALRVVARADPGLFSRVVRFARARYEADRATYAVSAEVAALRPPDALSPGEAEAEYLDRPAGRQVLHVTYGSLLSPDAPAEAQALKARLLDTLAENAGLHTELVAAHLGRHIAALESRDHDE